MTVFGILFTRHKATLSRYQYLKALSGFRLHSFKARTRYRQYFEVSDHLYLFSTKHKSFSCCSCKSFGFFASAESWDAQPASWHHVGAGTLPKSFTTSQHYRLIEVSTFACQLFKLQTALSIGFYVMEVKYYRSLAVGLSLLLRLIFHACRLPPSILIDLLYSQLLLMRCSRCDFVTGSFPSCWYTF